MDNKTYVLPVPGLSRIIPNLLLLLSDSMSIHLLSIAN